MLRLDGVVKHYRSGPEVIRAVDGVTLQVAAGEMVALRGPSGSGKTTLLELAARFYQPDSGTVRFQGRDLADLSEREAADYLRRDVGFIFQDFDLWLGVSAQENAALKLLADPVDLSAARREGARWLRRLGLGHKLEVAPEHLSGGERQRVAIAQAMATAPRLILADEPTASLDTDRKRDVMEHLRSIAHEHDAAVLLVTHDAEAAAYADRSIRIRDGKLEAGAAPAASGRDAVAAMPDRRP
jgi:putative ABC transport system ATP-binding protein